LKGFEANGENRTYNQNADARKFGRPLRLGCRAWSKEQGTGQQKPSAQLSDWKPDMKE